MKGKFTLKNILVLVAFVFGLVAFILAFSAGLKMTVSEMGMSVTTNMKGLIMGKQKMIVGTVETVAEDGAHAKLSAVGAVLLLVAPVLAVVATFLLPKGKGKFILLVCELAVILGIIFVVVMKDSYARSVVAKTIKDSGAEVSKEAKKEAVKDMKEMLKDYKLNDSAVFTIICGFLSAIALAVAQMVKGKK